MQSSLAPKKIFYVILGIIVIAAVGFFIVRWLAFPGGTPQPTNNAPSTSGGVGAPSHPPLPAVTPSGKTGTENPPTPEQGTVTQITTFPVIAPSLNTDENKVLFYQKDGGGLYAFDFAANSSEKLSNITIVHILNAVWSPAKDRRAVFYQDKDIVKGFLHIGTSSVASLPQNIESFAWSPDGKKTAYTATQDGITNLVTTDASGQNARIVFSTPFPEARITWISPTAIGFQTAPSGQTEGFIFIWSSATGALERFTGPLLGLMSRWTPAGTRALISYLNPTTQEVTLARLQRAGSAFPQVTGVATLADKCTVNDETTAYCAVPRVSPSGTAWPDTYLTGETNTFDRIVRINLETGEVKNIWNAGLFDISSLIATKGGTRFFFIDRRDGTLWTAMP